jgi:hypothetical protein
MIYYNKNLEVISCPYGISFLDNEIKLLNKTAMVMSLAEYKNFSNLTNTVDLLFLYEWSGWLPIPQNLADNTFVFYYDFTQIDSLDKNIFYYPHWLFYVANIESNNDITTDYLFSCACRNFNNGRPGKIYNYQLLKNKNYFNDIFFTKFKSIEPFEFHSLPEVQDEEFSLIINDFLEDYKNWQPMNYDELDLVRSMGTVDLDVYKKSLFHIVAETSIDQTLLSEKTFKVFLSGQIPIMCGPQNAIKHLRDLGFDVFDDIIDHSYDSILHWKERILGMHTCLDSLAKLDHHILLEETYNRRIKNQQHLKSKELHKKLLDPIAKQLFG